MPRDSSTDGRFKLPDWAVCLILFIVFVLVYTSIDHILG